MSRNGTMGLSIVSCRECEALNKGIEISDMFNWGAGLAHKAIAFDNDTDEILVVEERLLHVIQLMNPAQKPRGIRLITEEEWRERNSIMWRIKNAVQKFCKPLTVQHNVDSDSGGGRTGVAETAD